MDRLFSLSCAIVAVALTVPGVARGVPEGQPASGPKTCTVGQTPTNQSVTVDQYTLQASFKCANGAVGKFLPSCNTQTENCCCTNSGNCDNGDLKPIAEVLRTKGYVTYSGDTYTVTIDGIPTDRSTKMYYICRDSSDHRCTVTVELPKEAPAENECALGRTLQFGITEAAKSSQFLCKGPDGTKLSPVSDDGCANAAELATQYASARFPTAEVNGPTDAFTVSFPTLPEKPVKLCYRCQYPDPTPATYPDDIQKPSQRPCNVQISVGAAGITPSKTSTQTTNLGGEVVPGAGFVAILAALLIGAAGA